MPLVSSLAVIHWNFAPHDNDAIGWLATAAYLFAALFCGQIWLRSRMHPTGLVAHRHPWFWCAAALLLLGLGLNKQLDFQTLLHEAGRDWTQSHGWYESRRTAQKFFVAALAGLMICAVVILRKPLLGMAQSNRLFFLGASLVTVYVGLRVASIEHLQGKNNARWEHSRKLGAVEVAGATLMALAAMRELRAKTC